MMQLEQYIAGWRAHDVAAILATLAPDCVVIESFDRSIAGTIV